MNYFLLELVGQTYDLDRLKGAFVHADPATYAEFLRYLRFAFLTEGNDFHSSAHLRAVLDTFNIAPLRLAAILQQGCDAHGLGNNHVQ